MCLKKLIRYSQAFLKRNDNLLNQTAPPPKDVYSEEGLIFAHLLNKILTFDKRKKLLLFSLTQNFRTFAPNEGCFDAFAPLAMV